MELLGVKPPDEPGVRTGQIVWIVNLPEWNSVSLLACCCHRRTPMVAGESLTDMAVC